MRKDQSVLSHRQALRAWLLSLPGWDLLTNQFSMQRLGVVKDKVMAGGTPANPAALASYLELTVPR